jgi:hypothetical protein
MTAYFHHMMRRALLRLESERGHFRLGTAGLGLGRVASVSRLFFLSGAKSPWLLLFSSLALISTISVPHIWHTPRLSCLYAPYFKTVCCAVARLTWSEDLQFDLAAEFFRERNVGSVAGVFRFSEDSNHLSHDAAGGRAGYVHT